MSLSLYIYQSYHFPWSLAVTHVSGSSWNCDFRVSLLKAFLFFFFFLLQLPESSSAFVSHPFCSRCPANAGHDGRKRPRPWPCVSQVCSLASPQRLISLTWARSTTHTPQPIQQAPLTLTLYLGCFRNPTSPGIISKVFKKPY